MIEPTEPPRPYRLRPSAPGDLPAVLRLLTEAQLPVDGVGEHFGTFIVADEGHTLAGAIGLELYGETGLLRSAVVSPSSRNSGLGSRLVTEILSLARLRGVHRVVLLTTTAERFFSSRGFHRIDRATVSGPVTASKEFSGACPASAVCMERRL